MAVRWYERHRIAVPAHRALTIRSAGCLVVAPNGIWSSDVFPLVSFEGTPVKLSSIGEQISVDQEDLIESCARARLAHSVPMQATETTVIPTP
jgi:hypothetical protein